MTSTEEILGYPVSKLGLEESVDKIFYWLNHSEKTRLITFVNPCCIRLADPDLKQAFLNADLILPDSAGIVWASKVQNGDIQEKVTCSALFEKFNQAMDQEYKYSCCFLGWNEEVLWDIRKKMVRTYRKVPVYGAYPAIFKSQLTEADSQAMIRQVNLLQPDVLWVGMGSMQEKWIYQHLEQLNVKIVCAVDEVFYYHAKRKMYDEHEYEWFIPYRLYQQMQEYKHRWKKRLIFNPAFIYRVLMKKLLG